MQPLPSRVTGSARRGRCHHPQQGSICACVTPSPAARAVEQDVINDVADATTNSSEVLGLSKRRSAARHGTSSRSAFDVADGPISLNANQPVWRNLPVVADLATAKDAVWFARRGVQENTCCSERVVAGVTPAIPDVTTDIKAGPTTLSAKVQLPGLGNAREGLCSAWSCPAEP